VEDSGAAGTSSRAARHSKHPFENSKGLLVVLPNDAIDVEEEGRLYDELCAATQSVSPDLRPAPIVSLNVPITSRCPSNSPMCMLLRTTVMRITYRF
jgi:hypothetical protein